MYVGCVSIFSVCYVHYVQYLLAVGNFFTVSLGGLFIGFIFGCLTAIMTRFTEHVRGQYFWYLLLNFLEYTIIIIT